MAQRYRVIISPAVTSELAEIYAYIERDSPQNASAMISALVDAIDSLEILPQRHPVYRGKRQPSEAVRRMPVPPYLIYYRVNEPHLAVDILRVRHGARRQPRRFNDD